MSEGLVKHFPLKSPSAIVRHECSIIVRTKSREFMPMLTKKMLHDSTIHTVDWLGALVDQSSSVTELRGDLLRFAQS